MTQGVQTQESFVTVPPNVPQANNPNNVRQVLGFEFQPATGTFVLVQTEVVAVADPVTNQVVRLATSEQADDVISLLRANLRAQVAVLNVLSSENNFEMDDFMRDDEDG